MPKIVSVKDFFHPGSAAWNGIIENHFYPLRAHSASSGARQKYSFFCLIWRVKRRTEPYPSLSCCSQNIICQQPEFSPFIWDYDEKPHNEGPHNEKPHKCKGRTTCHSSSPLAAARSSAASAEPTFSRKCAWNLFDSYMLTDKWATLLKNKAKV